MNNGNKSYGKYYVKRNPASGYTEEQDGKPVLGECAKKDCRLENRHVSILNRGWRNSGVFFIESEERNAYLKELKEEEKAGANIKNDFEELKSKSESKDNELEDQKNEIARLTAIVEANKDNDNKSYARLALETEANELGVSFRANIGDDKLQLKINETKNK